MLGRRWQVLLSVTLVALACGCTREEARVPVKPNMVLILTDDHAKNAMSIYNDQLISTPNLDRIGEEGVVFENCFVTNSICAPSRAAILTGKYSHMNGLMTNQDTFDTYQTTFISKLQEAGYETILVGKWHLKEKPVGFDHWEVLMGQGEYYNPLFRRAADTIQRMGYSTDVITDTAIEYLEKRDKNKPFCLLYWHKAPHRNWMPDTRHLDLFEDDLPYPETFEDDYSTRSQAVRDQDMRIADMYLSMDLKLQPGYYDEETGTGGAPNHDAVADWARLYDHMDTTQKAAWDAHYDVVNQEFADGSISGDELTKWKYQRYMKDYLRCVVSVDENVGRLLEFLDGEGELDTTLVIYSSDQGFYLGEHGWYDKRFMYEESFGTPLVMRYPPAIDSAQRRDHLVLNIDLGPTMLEYAGVAVPAEMQGSSLRSIIADGEVESREAVYYHYYQAGGWHTVARHYGVRTDRYKLLHYYDQPYDDWELYDLVADPHEMNNVYDSPDYNAVQEELKAQLIQLRSDLAVTD